MKKTRSGFKDFKEFLIYYSRKTAFFSVETDEKVSSIFATPALMILVLYISQICFVCGIPVDILYGFPQDGFIWGCVGKFLISLIALDLGSL